MDKVARSAAAAVADVPHGATLLFGGFGVVQGWPNSLLLALRDHGARDLTVIFNTPGVGPLSAQLLAEAGLIRRVIASFAAYPTRPTPIEEQIKAGRIELELVPQGTLAERDEVVAPGEIDPECVVTPGIYVDRVVRTEHPLDVEEIRALSRRYGRAVHMTPRPDLGGLPPDLMARRAALLLRDGEYVNLGLGLPTLVSNHIDAARDIVLHSENGMLGFGPLAEERDEDVDLYNASGQLVSLLPGAAFFDSLYAHGMARGGRVTTVVLGAFQVSEKGDLANWNVPASGKAGIGGAMDLAAGRARVLVVTYHATRAREPKLVRRSTYPLTPPACVRHIVTDLAYLTVEPEGFVLRELAPGVPLERVRQLTGAPLRVASDLRVMEFS